MLTVSLQLFTVDALSIAYAPFFTVDIDDLRKAQMIGSIEALMRRMHNMNVLSHKVSGPSVSYFGLFVLNFAAVIFASPFFIRSAFRLFYGWTH